jgi:hypothetical protein
MRKHPIIHLIIFWLVVAPSGNISAQEPKSQDDLSAYLPNLAGLAPDGLPEKAEGAKGLFAVINGGAELFVKYGFCRALFQTYKTRGNKLINFELF